MKKSNTLLVNLFAGPGTGKSSTMAGVFSELKWRGVNCEMAPEFAKEKVWEGSLGILGNQIYVFGKQLNTIYRVLDKVDVIITDSPLLLSLIYGENESQKFKDLVLDIHSNFNNYNVFLKRHKKYNPSGRLQSEEGAKEIDVKIKKLLSDNLEMFFEVDSGRNSITVICDNIMDLIGEDKAKYS